MPEVRVSVDELVLEGLKVSAPVLLYLLLCMCGPLVLSQFFLLPSFANTSADTVMLPWFLSLQEASISSLGQSDMSEVFHKTLWCELCQGQQDAALGSRLNTLRSPKNFQCGGFLLFQWLFDGWEKTTQQKTCNFHSSSTRTEIF